MQIWGNIWEGLLTTGEYFFTCRLRHQHRKGVPCHWPSMSLNKCLLESNYSNKITKTKHERAECNFGLRHCFLKWSDEMKLQRLHKMITNDGDVGHFCSSGFFVCCFTIHWGRRKLNRLNQENSSEANDKPGTKLEVKVLLRNMKTEDVTVSVSWHGIYRYLHNCFWKSDEGPGARWTMRYHNIFLYVSANSATQTDMNSRWSQACIT